MKKKEVFVGLNSCWKCLEYDSITTNGLKKNISDVSRNICFFFSKLAFSGHVTKRQNSVSLTFFRAFSLTKPAKTNMEPENTPLEKETHFYTNHLKFNIVRHPR